MADSLSLGDAIRCRRERLGYSLRALSSAIGISFVHLADIERGKRRTTVETIMSIERCLNLENGDLQRRWLPKELIAWVESQPDVLREIWRRHGGVL